MKFKYLPHTADAKFEAYGKTLEEAFENAAYALFNMIIETKKVEAKIKKNVAIRSENLESLLYDWLEKFLFLLDTENFLLSEAKVKSIKKKNEEYRLEAELEGDIFPKKYEIEGEVKAITYNEMQVKKQTKGWKITAVVDR